MMRNINNKRKFVVGAYLSRKKGGFYNTYHKLLSEKWIVTNPDFTCHKLYYSNQYQYLQYPTLWVVLNISTIVLRVRFTRVQSQSYQVGWIKYTLQDSLCQKFWQYKLQNAETLQWKSKSEIYRLASDSEVHWKLINLNWPSLL